MKHVEDENLANVSLIEQHLRYISGIIRQKGREILRQYKITPPQSIALQCLYEEGDMTIGDLSAKMFLACSTTTDLVDRMEKNQLVERIKDKSDRRVVRIHLLEKGSRVIEEVIKLRQRYLQETMTNFSSEETSNLKESLIKLHKGMLEE